MSAGAGKRSPIPLGKRTKGCDRGSEVGTVHSGRGGKGPVPLRKPKKSGERESFVSR